MKLKHYYRTIFLLLIAFNISFVKAQTITTDVTSVKSCVGTVTIPITVSNIINISAISLTLNYDNSMLSWDSYQNEQDELSSGFLIVNSNGSQIIISWFSLSPVSFGDDTLVELKFTANAGVGDLIWDLSAPDNCQFTDASYNNVVSIYKNGFVTVEDCSDIYGSVYYDNISNSAMNNSTIILKNVLGDKVDSTITDANGDFIFPSLFGGKYTIDVATTKAWGGVNSIDALGIMRHFVLLDTLQGIRLAAADVDASGFINTLDALFAAQRFALFITSFPSGDWLFQADTVTLLSGIDTTTVVKAICYGDIDASYLPPFVMPSPKVIIKK